MFNNKTLLSETFVTTGEVDKVSKVNYDIIKSHILSHHKKENYLTNEDFQKTTFKGEIGKFEIEKNKVNHQLQLYKIKKGKFIKVKKT